MVEAYCRWHDKFLRDVAEQEQDSCYEKNMNCDDCPDRIWKENTSEDGGEDPDEEGE